MIVCLKIIPLPPGQNGASNADVERIVDENITIDTVVLLTVWTLEQMFVHLIIRSLTSEAIRSLIFIFYFDETGDGEQVVIGACQMRCQDQCETTDHALHWKFAILCLARGTVVAFGGDLSRLF